MSKQEIKKFYLKRVFEILLDYYHDNCLWNYWKTYHEFLIYLSKIFKEFKEFK